MSEEKDNMFGRIITREMMTMIQDKSLDNATVGEMLRAIICDITPENKILASFANSFKSGYILVNSEYMEHRERRLESWRKYNAKRGKSTSGNDSRAVATTRNHSQPPIEENRKEHNIPLSPKGEKGEKLPPSVFDAIADEMESASPEFWADKMADEIREWYPYAVNESSLKKTLRKAFEKDSGARVEQGIRKWRESGAWDEERFMPRRLVAWIKEGHYLDEPPKKLSAARVERPTSAASADATLRILADNGEED